MLQTISPRPRPRLKGVGLLCAYAAAPMLVALGCLPLLVLRPAPLADWPSHLARVWMTAKVLAGDPFWSARYQFNGLLIPNAALDGAILALMRLGLPIQAAGAAFLVLCYAMFMAGFLRLGRLAGNPALASAACGTALFFTGNMIDGLVNYTAGIALLLCALSFWYPPGATVRRRVLIALVVTPAILFCHVVAALLFAGIALCHDLFRPARRMAGRALAAVPATLSLLIGLAGWALSATAGDNAKQMAWRGGPTLFGIVKGKVAVVLGALTCGNPAGDALLALLLGAVLVALWRNRAWVQRERAAPVAATAAMALLAPSVVGAGSLLDFRLTVLPLVLATATLPWSSRAAWRLTALVSVVAWARLVLLAASWHAYGPLYADLERQLAALPEGSTLLGAYADEDSFYKVQQPPLWNSASLAVPHGVFVPSVFADPTQQPLAVRPEWRPGWLWSHYANARTPERLTAAVAKARRFCTVDPQTHLLVLHASGGAPPLPAPNLLDGLAATRAALIALCPPG